MNLPPDDATKRDLQDAKGNMPFELAALPQAPEERARQFAEALEEVAREHQDLFALLAR